MTNSMTRPEARAVIVYPQAHVAVVIDTRGIRLGGQSFVADAGGYRALLTWADTHGTDRGLRHRRHRQLWRRPGAGRSPRRPCRGSESKRPAPAPRRRQDTIDAEAAARSVLAGQSTAIPKTAEPEMMRLLKIARDTAVKARTTAMITLKQRTCRPRCESGPHRSGAPHDRVDTPTRPPNTPSGRSPDAGSPSPMKSRRTTGTSRD